MKGMRIFGHEKARHTADIHSSKCKTKLSREYNNMPSAIAGTSFIKVSLIYSALRVFTRGTAHDEYNCINITCPSAPLRASLAIT